jgi:hypothetical protein
MFPPHDSSSAREVRALERVDRRVLRELERDADVDRSARPSAGLDGADRRLAGLAIWSTTVRST